MDGVKDLRVQVRRHGAGWAWRVVGHDTRYDDLSYTLDIDVGFAATRARAIKRGTASLDRLRHVDEPWEDI